MRQTHTTKRKALFILPPHRTDFNSWQRPEWQQCRIPPTGPISIVSYLNEQGYDARLIDGRELIRRYRTNDVLPLICEMIEAYKPDLIGLNMLTALFDEAKHIATGVKRAQPQIPLIAGGPHPSVEPVLTLQHIEGVDAVCIGPGEEVCLDLMQGRPIDSTPGLMHRDSVDGYEAREVERDIDRYPFPNYGLVDHEFYSSYSATTTFGWLTRSLSALTSRGCTYSCKFCGSKLSRPFRCHSVEYVMELARYLSRFDINTIAFWDDSMAAKRDRMFAIAERFTRSGLFRPAGRLRWRASMRANQVEPELLKAMKAAGCYHVMIGVESGADRVLAVMNKGTTVAMNEQACADVREAGLDLGVAFMVGVPTETEEEILQTFSFIQGLRCNTMGCGSFRPLPGSPFYEEFIQSGRLQKDEINWSNLGDFSAQPEEIFCDVERGKALELMEEGKRIAYGKRWRAVHEDVAEDCELLIEEMRRHVDVHVVPSTDRRRRSLGARGRRRRTIRASDRQCGIRWKCDRGSCAFE